MVILPATEADLQAVIELVAQGRAALARQGVDQWQDGYPSPETVRRDLLRGDGRIVRIDGAAAAYAAFVFDGEPAYDRIEEGGWAAEGPYVAVHRLVVASASCGGELPPRCCAKPPARRSCAASARSASTRIPTTGPCVRCS